MSPVDRAGSVTEMKLVSVHMMTFSPLSEMKNLNQRATFVTRGYVTYRNSLKLAS